MKNGWATLDYSEFNKRSACRIRTTESFYDPNHPYKQIVFGL